MKSKRPRVFCTTSPQVVEAIEKLLWTGLWGSNRAEVMDRLLCAGIRTEIIRGTLKWSDLYDRDPGKLIPANLPK